MLLTRGLLLSAFCLTVASCGKDRVESKTPEDASDAASPSPAPSVDESLHPVEAPQHLVGLARIHHPGTIVDGVMEQANLGIDWRAQLHALVPLIGQAIDFDASIDAAVIAERPDPNGQPRFLYALSIGIADPAAALDFMTNSGAAISPDGKRHRIRRAELSCTLGPAREVKSRLVCSIGSTAKASVDALFPFLSRGLGSDSSLPGLQVTAHAATIHRMYEPEIEQMRDAADSMRGLLTSNLSDPDLREASDRAFSALAEQMFALWSDIDDVKLSVEGDPSGVRMSFDMRFRGRSSFLVQQLERNAAVAGPPPPRFWSIPADTPGASYSHFAPAPETPAIHDTLEQLVRGTLKLVPASEKKETRLLKALRASFDAAQTAPSNEFILWRLNPSKNEQPFDLSSVSLLQGTVMSYAHADTTTGPLIESLIALYNDRTLRKNAMKDYPELEELWKRVKLSIKRAPRSAKLPRGAMEFHLRSTVEEASFSFYGVTATASEHACIGFGGRPEALYTSLRHCISPSGDTLASRTDLEDMKELRVMNASFSDFGSDFLTALRSALSKKVQETPELKSVAKEFAQFELPHQRALMRASSDMRDLQFNMTAHLPKAVIDNLGAVISFTFPKIYAAYEKAQASPAPSSPAN